jgi:hypothetical protein
LIVFGDTVLTCWVLFCIFLPKKYFDTKIKINKFVLIGKRNVPNTF